MREKALTGVLRNILTVFSHIQDSLPKLGPSDPVTYFIDDPQEDEPSAPTKTVTIEEPTATTYLPDTFSNTSPPGTCHAEEEENPLRSRNGPKTGSHTFECQRETSHLNP